jgi:two-component system response regulator AtoC
MNFQIRDLKNENTYLKNELLNKYVNKEFVTKNKQLKSIIREVDKIKNNPITILITGESGTGKEVLSEYIHFTSNRKEERFVSINCAALSENLLLSELFGHERGAFTGAIEKKIGKFELANKGTLFLDEIGDMSLDIQSKLLKVIEENSFERVGSIKRINVDARLVTATNQDLKKLIKEGRFRQDLYYRINVVSFNIPPLRDRKEDIPLLSYHLMNKYSLKYNKKSLKISDRAIALLNSYHWPGNVRELENIVNQAVLLSTNDYLNIDIIKKNISSDVKVENEKLTIDITTVTSLKKKINSIIELYERNIINQFLLKNGFNKSKTARELLITRKTLRQKMKKYNLN